MAYLKLNANGYSETTREPDGDDSWDRGDSSTNWDVHGLLVLPSDEYQAIKSCFSAAAGDSLWAVYVIYSTGDSFGHDADANLELIDVFKDKTKADAAAAALSGSDKSWTREDGSVAKMEWKPWDGYFESLSSMNVELFDVEAR